MKLIFVLFAYFSAVSAGRILAKTSKSADIDVVKLDSESVSNEFSHDDLNHKFVYSTFGVINWKKFLKSFFFALEIQQQHFHQAKKIDCVPLLQQVYQWIY